MTAAQRRVLEAMGKGTVLMECCHVRLQDGTSYWLGQDVNNRVAGSTVHVLIQREWIEPVRMGVGGNTYGITPAGRAALTAAPRRRGMKG